MSTYTITTADGKQIKNLAMNGSMFVSQREITLDELTKESLAQVTILETGEDGNKETVLHNAVCDGVLRWPEGWLFNLRELTDHEIKVKAQEAQIEMLTDCILEMSEIIYGG